MMRRPYTLLYPESWWQAAEEAKSATCKSIALGEKPDYKKTERIWKNTKVALLDHFRGKCAYCESLILENHPGAVEHYRPKAAIDDRPDHPGYYWLAFDPRNYLLSCYTCNSSHKRNRFTVVDDLYWEDPTTPNAERPYLLNPYDDWMFDHLDYDFEFTDVGVEPTGHIISVNRSKDDKDRGTQSIEICGLNRAGLPGLRQEAQLREIMIFRMYLQDRRGTSEDYIERLKVDRNTPFTTARMAAVWAHEDWLLEQKKKELEREVIRQERRERERKGNA